MPGITAGMGFQRDYIGISKISAYGRLNYFFGRAKVNLRWIVIKSDPVRVSKGIG